MRPPEVFVRELSPEEGMQLRSISEASEVPVEARAGDDRARLGDGDVGPADRRAGGHRRLARAQGTHAFNEEGFGSLDPDYRGGRPKKTTPVQRDRIVAVARARPDTQGVALTRRSLPKLRDGPIQLIPHQGSQAWSWSRRRPTPPT
jgi:hypothetical protein